MQPAHPVLYHPPQLAPNILVVMLTVYEDTENIFNALAAGAAGYLLKRTKSAELLEAIREVHEGGSPMSASIARKVVQSLQQGRPHGDETTELSPREHEVLNGLAEAVGEMRRYVLDMLRRGEVDGCERLLGAMDDIYSLLVTLDYPDALTGGLRRTTDSTRGILEKTRGDLTLALRQEALVEALQAAERVGGGQ